MVYKTVYLQFDIIIY